MRRIGITLCVAALALLTSCNSKKLEGPDVQARASVPTSPTVATGSPAAGATGCSTAANTYSDTFRGHEVVISLPKPSTRPRPVVVALHGYNGQAQDFATYTGLDKRAPAAGVVLLAPQGQITSAGGPGWNFERAASIGADDVDLIDAMLDHYKDALCLDLTRLVVTGWSDGADMAVTFACHGKHVPRGVLAVAAASGADGRCGVRSIVFVHGTADPIEPYHGGAPDPRPGYNDFKSISAPAMAESFKASLGCTVTAPGPQGNGYATTIYTSCRTGGQVELVTIQGGGHPWPRSTYDVSTEYGPTNHTFDTTNAVLNLTG